MLREGGFLVITDFDTPVKYRRVNKHSANVPVYKMVGAGLFKELGYSIAEKVSYHSDGEMFHLDIQERISTQILYKEYQDELYADV